MGGGGLDWAAPTSTPPQMPAQNCSYYRQIASLCRGRGHPVAAGQDQCPRPTETGPAAGTGEPAKGRGVEEERCGGSWDGKRTGRRGEWEVG